MINSILDSTKKILNIDFSYHHFDQDILTHINAAFAKLNQLGVGPPDGFFIEDSDETWADFQTQVVSETESILHVPNNQLHLVKTYVYLNARMGFDPPGTSYLVTAMEKQILEHEWRLNVFRENTIPLVITRPVLVEEVVW